MPLMVGMDIFWNSPFLIKLIKFENFTTKKTTLNYVQHGFVYLRIDNNKLTIYSNLFTVFAILYMLCCHSNGQYQKSDNS